MTTHWAASTANIQNRIIYLLIESHRWQAYAIWLSICTLNHIDGKHTQSNHLFVRHAYKGINGLTVGLIYICMYPIYQACLRVWQKDTPKGYYFDNRWYTSVASATTGLDSTRLSTPTGVVHWATSMASMHNLIIYLHIEPHRWQTYTIINGHLAFVPDCSTTKDNQHTKPYSKRTAPSAAVLFSYLIIYPCKKHLNP